MNSSPVTPTGIARSCSSSTCSSVLAMGRPTRTMPTGLGSRHADDQMVVSVGPYRFQASPQRVANCSARSAGRASPPTRALNPSPPDQPDANNARHVEVVVCRTVTRPRAKRLLQQTNVGDFLASRQADAGSAKQGQPDLETGDIKRYRSHGQHAVARGHPGSRCHTGQKVDELSMLDLHALGVAGRT